MVNCSRIITALDFTDPDDAIAFATQLDPKLCRLKVGKALFTAGGPKLIESLHKLGYEIFLDLKFHDIPHQVKLACQVAAQLGIWMLNVHAQGGRSMLQAAREGIDAISSPKPFLIGVTLLTSLDASDLSEIGLSGTPLDNVLRLATLTQACGLDGVVCSAKEAAVLREHSGSDFLLVTPGIRLPENSAMDQKRVVTPLEALRSGSSYLVVGRPITEAPHPLVALQKFYELTSDA